MTEFREMTAEEFRRQGYAMVDWLADYLDGVGSVSVQPDISPGTLRRMLPSTPPEAPESFNAIAADMDRVVVPGLTNWLSPGWFAFFPSVTSGPGILGEMAAAGLGQQGMIWATSPICTELENVVMDWMVDLLGLPGAWKTTDQGGGVIQQTASDAAHVALVVAREQARRRGADPANLVAYSSSQAHSSVEKGAKVAGFRHLRLIDVDNRYAMRAEALREKVMADLATGLVPTFVCSAVGSTGTTAVDPVRRIGDLAREVGMWHHVDAAFAGNAMICEEFRHHQDGLELVDSYTVNPYKWLPMTFEGSLFFVADRKPLIETLSILPEYLRNEASASGQVIDYRDWHVALGRPFRSLKLWFVLRYFGAADLRARIRANVRWARRLADLVEEHPKLEMVAPVPFSLVCFRHADGNEATERLGATINASGHSYLTPSRIGAMSYLRVSIGQISTRWHHVERLWKTILAGCR